MNRLREPTRLDQGESPDELHGALHALGSESPSAEALQRMREGLAARLAGGAAAHSGGTILLGGAASKVILAGLVVAGLGGAAVWRARHEVKPAAESSVAQRVQPSDSPPAASPPNDSSALPPEDALSPAQLSAAAPRPALRGRAESPRASVARTSRGTRQSITPVGAREITVAERAPERAEVPLPALNIASSPADQRAEPAVSPGATEAARAAAMPKIEPQPTAAPDEVTLLRRARKLKDLQPIAALQQLDQHQRDYPNGMLAPEREILAIELLRVLGRVQQALNRAEAFRHRYPDSPYLARLPQR